MKIKKLSIKGFKSFMDKVDIPFPVGISAVVGPNGCGKSNIVDAIRWAMGEQSAKLLRGRQMEDVIFNGAGDFKPLGMAEVSIIMENGDGSFPAEYSNASELSITRRLYRSGESEYLINSVPCRLKDIQEIFMDTGLGNRAYSIIGQGRIGNIVDQKPEETRIMLEEAAGITKYKKKETESRRRLELTKTNLRRVEDILVEVDSQMRSLKRQASKAMRFKAIGQEIQRLELVFNSNTYHELEAESGTKGKSTEELVQKEIMLSGEHSVKQARVEAMNFELEEKDSEISTIRNRYLNIKEAFNRKEAAIESLAGEKRMQEEMEGRLGQEKEDIGRTLVRLGEERLELQERAANLKQTTMELDEEISVVENRLKAKKELLGEIKEEYERVRDRVNSDVTRQAGLNQESGYLGKRIDEITDSSKRLEKEKEEAGQKIGQLLESSRAKNETRSALTEKLEYIDREIQETQQGCEELERIYKGIEIDLKKADADLNMCSTRLGSLRSLSDNFEGYKVGVRTIMKAVDLRPRNEGKVLGLVADVIQVESQYEQAVEAVMSDKLQYIIVADQEDGREAVEYLKARAKGRSSFVSMSLLNGAGSNGNGNGFPLLRDVVKTSDSYRSLVNMLLGDTVLADNLEQAITAWRSNGKDHSFVTPEGDMVDERGIISGGKLTSGSQGLLSRKREIRELEEGVERYGRAVDECKDKLENIRYQLEEKRSVFNTLSEEKLKCQNEVNELDKIIFRLSHELDQLERLSERIAADFEKIAVEQSRHRDALNKISSELKLCEEKKRNQEEYLMKKGLELRESEDEFDEMRSQLEKLKMDCSLSREEERGLLREMERIDDFSEEAREKMAKIELDILKGKERQSEYLNREEFLKDELKNFYSRLEKAEEAVRTAEQERNEFHAMVREENRKSEELRDELDHLKDSINRARMEQSEITFKLNSLKEQVKERFNLDLSGIYNEYLEEDFSAQETKEKLEEQKRLRTGLGEVNLTAIQEHEALKERHGFIQGQRQDLLNSMDAINQAIRKINKTCLERFMSTFEEADKKLKEVFPILFSGGTAGLKLTDESNPLESGVLVEVRPPGKKVSHMGLLSGGEKALVAMSLLFAIYLIKPSPFCLLDEVDAPLDDANVDRFNELLKEIRKYSQVLMVTHNKKSMEIVDSLYGVTMEKKGVSKMVSVNLSSNILN